MEIDPAETYTEFTFARDNVLWTIPGPLSGDLVAGLVYATDVILYVQTRGNNFNLTIGHKGYIPYDPQPRNNRRNYHENYIGGSVNNFRGLALFDPRETNYGWWIINHLDGREYYQLIQFASAEFIQGFISIFNAFGSDFRDYIVGRPFKVLPDGSKIEYNIVGYDIGKFEVKARIPAPVGAYYTGAREADAYGEDFE